MTIFIFEKASDIKECEEKDLIELRTIGFGSFFAIDKQKFLAFKKFYISDAEFSALMEREMKIC